MVWRNAPLCLLLSSFASPCGAGCVIVWLWDDSPRLHTNPVSFFFLLFSCLSFLPSYPPHFAHLMSFFVSTFCFALRIISPLRFFSNTFPSSLVSAFILSLPHTTLAPHQNRRGEVSYYLYYFYFTGWWCMARSNRAVFVLSSGTLWDSPNVEKTSRNGLISVE